MVQSLLKFVQAWMLLGFGDSSRASYLNRMYT